jgi:hypothetical protein
MLGVQRTELRDTVALLRQQLRQCHADLDEVADGWLQQARFSKAWSQPVRLYMHALCVEDVTIQSVLRAEAPLFSSPICPHPSDPAALGRYARAVYAATDRYLAELHTDGLNRVVDLEKRGFGRRSVAWVIRRFIVGELGRRRGEISAATAP